MFTSVEDERFDLTTGQSFFLNTEYNQIKELSSFVVSFGKELFTVSYLVIHFDNRYFHVYEIYFNTRSFKGSHRKEETKYNVNRKKECIVSL